MKIYSISSLRTRLALLIILSMLPILGLTVITYLKERRLALLHIEDDVKMISSFVSGTQEKMIETTRQLLVAVSKIPDVRTLNQQKCNSNLREILDENPGYINLGIILPDGNPFCTAIPMDPSENFLHQTWFQGIAASQGFAIGSYHSRGGVERQALYFGYPLVDDSGDLQAVLYAAVDFSEFDQLALQVQLPWLSEILMISAEGKVLVYSPGPERSKDGSKPDMRIVDAILSRGKGFVEMEGSDGVERLYAFTPLNSIVETGLYVGIAFPKRVVYKEVNSVLLHHFIGLSLITLLALSAVWLGSNTLVVRRINILVDAAQRLSRLDMGARTGLAHGRGELGRLASAFDDMAEALEHRTVKLEEAELKYRMLVEQLPVITYTAKPDETRRCFYVSPQVNDILGFTQDEWLATKELWLGQIHAEDTQRVLLSLRNSLEGHESFHSEYRIYSKEGALLWVSDEAVAVRNPEGICLYLLGIIRDISEERKAEEKLLEYQKQLRSLASQVSLAEERERRRIAVDLHDQVAQTLALSRIKLEMLKRSIASTTHADSLEDIRELIIQAIRDTRSLVFKISPPVLYELGIEAALEWIAEQTQKEHGITVKCQSDGLEKPLDNDVRGFVFRAVSELLVNVTKHSGADHAGIIIARDEGSVKVTVWDNGLGFDSSTVGCGSSGTDGFGLFSIRERLDHIQGSIKIETKPGLGTRITLMAPLSCKEDADATPA